MNQTFSVAPGRQVLSFQAQFSPIYGVWINNFSGGWLGIEGQNLWCPPYTRGWKATIFPGISQITIKSYSFANGAEIVGATGQAAQVTIWDEPNGDSEGIDFFDAQTVPFAVRTVANAPNGAVYINPPAVGRVRVYEVRLKYYDDFGGASPHTSAPVICSISATGGVIIAELAISPASPIDASFLTVPGGDAPIGNGIRFDMLCPDTVDTQTRLAIFTRWANI